jgi:hypothetical protein
MPNTMVSKPVVLTDDRSLRVGVPVPAVVVPGPVDAGSLVGVVPVSTVLVTSVDAAAGAVVVDALRRSGPVSPSSPQDASRAVARQSETARRAG